MRPFDEQMLLWGEGAGVPCHVLLTKSDKLKRGPAQATLLKVRKSLPPGASAQVYSAKNKQGLAELIRQLDIWYAMTPPDSTAGPESANDVKTRAC